MTIENNIRALREERNISQARLAELIGIKGSTDRISMWERGYMCPHLKNFMRMLEVFGVQAKDVYPNLASLPDAPTKKKKTASDIFD